MNNLKLEIYDPPMCCSSGVCGPNVNPELVRFSSDLEWLKIQGGVDVQRYNLSSNPAAFTSQDIVKESLVKEGNGCLPVIFANDVLVSKGRYPTRDELKGFLGIESDNTVSEDKKTIEQAAVCGPGCDCGKPSGNKKLKMLLCLIVVLAIGGIFVYKAKNVKQNTPVNTPTAFVAPVANEVNEPTVSTIDKQEPAAKVENSKKVGEFLDSLASLNKVAVNQDAVFVFIPVKGNDIADLKTADVMLSAQQKLKSNGVSIGLYTLQSGSPEYANIAKQITPPSILIMSKGRGSGAVSGEITETKILQAYVASSRAGGCGSSCSPSTPGCGPSSQPLGPRI